MRAQLSVKFLPSFLGEEDSGVLQLHALACPGKRVGEPPRPFHVEVDIARSPNDERRSFQRLQAAFDSHRVSVVEGREKALEVTRTLLRPHQRSYAGPSACRER